MSSDPNKKSARTFQCRDVLWETFEQMARELECSVDYLINEAMKQYARQRSYGSRTPFPGGPSRGESAAANSAPGQGFGGHPTPAAPPPPAMSRGGAMPLPPPPARSLGGPPPRSPGSLPVPPPPPPGGRGGQGLGVPTPPPRGGSLGMPPPNRSAPPGAPRSVPPPLPRGVSGLPPAMGSSMSSPVGMGGAMSTGMGGLGNANANQNAMNNGGYSQPSPSPQGNQLNVIYQGEKQAVNKDRFVIGRGKQSSDLTLKDPNVSRQHAMIEFQNGVYFMVDMGSTNGVEYNGQRIARKQIAEGDVFRICDHDLFFTYR